MWMSRPRREPSTWDVQTHFWLCGKLLVVWRAAHLIWKKLIKAVILLNTTPGGMSDARCPADMLCFLTGHLQLPEDQLPSCSGWSRKKKTTSTSWFHRFNKIKLIMLLLTLVTCTDEYLTSNVLNSAVHWSATMFKRLSGDVKNIYHLVIIMCCWETPLTPLAVGLQSNGPFWTTRTTQEWCKQSDNKFWVPIRTRIHGTFSVRGGSTLKHLVPTAPKERCFQSLTDQRKSEPWWGFVDWTGSSWRPGRHRELFVHWPAGGAAAIRDWTWTLSRTL